MILIQFVQLVLLIFMALVGTLGTAIWAYSIALGAGLKGDAEQILFYGLLLSALELASFFLLVMNAARKKRELVNLSNLVRYGGSISDERLEGFGFFGMQVRSMIRELSDASDRKSVRIASLSGLVRAAVELTDRSILVVGLDGRIIAASKPILSSPGFEDLKVGNSSIEEFLPSTDLRSVLEETDRTHGIVERPVNISFIPVYSINGEITHFLIDMARKGALETIAELLHAKRGSAGKKLGKDPAAPAGPSMRNKVRSFFSGINRKQEPLE